MFGDNNELAPGLVVDGTYEIIALLGSGGMGKVYLCKHVLMHKQYALKTLSVGQENDENWIRFQSEGKAVARLSHPNLVKVHNMGVYDQRVPYYVMDLLEGESLKELIDRGGAIDQKVVLQIFLSACAGLECAHKAKIIHRDIKPANIMLLKENGRYVAKLVDFGLVKSLDGAIQSLTATGQIMGSPLYLSPEQAVGSNIGYASDLYSLGVSLFEALTGKVPHKGANAMQTIMMHQSQVAPTLENMGAGVEFSDEIEMVVATLLAKQPEMRYQSTQELIADLTSLSNNQRLPLSSPARKNLRLRGADIVAQERARSSRAYATEASQSITSAPASDRRLFKLVTLILTGVLVVGIATTFGVNYFKAKNKMSVAVAPVKAQPPAPSAHYLQSISPSGERTFVIPAALTEGEFGLEQHGRISPFKPVNNKLVIGGEDRLRYTPAPSLTQSPALMDGFSRDDLQVLDLTRCSIGSNDVLRHCRQLDGLRELDVSGTDCDIQGLSAIESMYSLTFLKVNQTAKLAATEFVKLNALKHLKRLEYGSCRAIPQLLSVLAPLPKFNQLEVANSPITIADCQKIAATLHLHSLNLDNCQINRTKFLAILKCKDLEHLYIRHQSLPPEFLELLAGAPPQLLIDLTEQTWLPRNSPFLASHKNIVVKENTIDSAAARSKRTNADSAAILFSP